MSAAEALRAARAASVRLGMDGDVLTLEAATAPPPAILNLLARHKVGILALLRPANDGWSGGDWLAFFDERTGSAAIHGLTGIEAEARAFDCCVVEWLKRNPVRSPPGRCLGCGGSEHAHDKLLQFGAEPTGRTLLHACCWSAWHARRLAEAARALRDLGVGINDKEA